MLLRLLPSLMTPSRPQWEPPASLDTDGDCLPDDEPLNFPVLRLTRKDRGYLLRERLCLDLLSFSNVLLGFHD